MEQYSFHQPSKKYAALLEEYKNLHLNGDPISNHSGAETFDGRSLMPHVPLIRHLFLDNNIKTMLDYGCGKALGYEKATFTTPEGATLTGLKSIWNLEKIELYDPAYEPYSSLKQDKHNAVICTDVLEHIPEEDIAWTLTEIFAHADKLVFLTAALYKAAKTFPNGENVHVTVKPFHWWVQQLEQAKSLFPDVHYCLVGIEINERKIQLLG